MYAEIIFEPGAKSLLSFDNETELKGFLTEHHKRALTGENGGPAGHSAERISKVLTYSTHPGDFAGNAVSSDKVSGLVSAMDQNGSLDANQLISALRDETSPVYPVDQGRHESIYKMSGTNFDLSFLESGDTSAA